MDKKFLFRIIFVFISGVFICFFLINCIGKTPGEILAISDNFPHVDGIINTDEYSMIIETEKMTLHLSRNNETLFFGLTGRTMGWSSVGFGGLGMDTSHIIIGYAENGSHVLEEHTGKAHTHTPAQKQIIRSSKIIDYNGNTTFEGSVKAADLIYPDQKALSLIIACGDVDNFTTRHVFRKSLAVKLTRD